MNGRVPVYRNHGEAFAADACLPLIRAAARHAVSMAALVHGHYPGRRLPAHCLPGLKTIGYWDAREDQDWGLPWHRNEGIELMFLETGCVAFAVDDVRYSLRPDDLTITRPWQLHSVGGPGVAAGRLHWLIIDVGVRSPNLTWRWPGWVVLSRGDRRELANILRQNEQPVWHSSADIRDCFRRISQAVQTDQSGSNASRLAVRVNDLLVLLLDLFRVREVELDESLSTSRRAVESFLAGLRTHPEHVAVDWNVHDMARSCGLGVTRFVHHVKALTNMTPMLYLNHCRLDLAARLLRERAQVSVTDVALRCGFCSSQYFATVFCRRFGHPPRFFRERLTADEDAGEAIPDVPHSLEGRSHIRLG